MGWELEGPDDFNVDGHAEIVWHKPSTAEAAGAPETTMAARSLPSHLRAQSSRNTRLALFELFLV